MIRKEDALRYHAEGRPGKLEVVPTKPVSSQRDLSLAYSPGVAEPCRAIAADPSKVGLYTTRSNLVGVITNGTAVLGLGDIGPLAAKPVMEGKAVLFKKFADIDVFDLELDASDPQRFVDIVAALEPTFGGINLEDIKGPECFFIEQELKKRLRIPVMHDDQHGTAIITSAALTNAAHLQGKDLENLRVACLGAGAAALGCLRIWTQLGIRRENVVMVDVEGVVKADRPGLDDVRAEFAVPGDDPRQTIADALRGADVMLGLSAANLVTEDMLRTMAERPIIFALANPDPEIPYEVARRARPDAIVGTGRSDHPNQVNNVLGFPYIFRGALDVGATEINDAMKLAAARALAELAREGVPEHVLAAYGGVNLRFGPDYIIPKPVDGRVLRWVAGAVAGAAMATGVATRSIDLERYKEDLDKRLNPTRRVMDSIRNVARERLRRIVFPEGEAEGILRAASIVVEERIAQPVLLGRVSEMHRRAEALGIDLTGVELLDRYDLPRIEEYSELFFGIRARRGVTSDYARRQMERSRTHYGMMMVAAGDAHGLVSGLTAPYADTIRPALQIFGTRAGVRSAAGAYLVITSSGVKFLADTTIEVEPDAETLANTAFLVADVARALEIEPRIAMLSFSNFGDAAHPSSQKVRDAVRIVNQRWPELMCDGEMQADLALSEAAREPYPFCRLKGEANNLNLPNHESGNLAYKLLGSIGDAEVIGPIVLGLRRAVNVLQQGASVSTIVHMTALTAARAIRLEREGLESLVAEG